MKANQKQRILDYIKQFGSITSKDAYVDLGNNAIRCKNRWVRKRWLFLRKGMGKRKEQIR